jgi:hypothetical protein
MRKIILLLSLALFTVHTPSYAKRAYIEYPDNITIKNIEYKASYETGNLIQKAFIVARNIETNEVVCRHSPTCLPAGRLVRGIQTPSPRKRGTMETL